MLSVVAKMCLNTKLHLARATISGVREKIKQKNP